MFQLFCKLFGNRFARKSLASRPRRRARLRLESLEDRCVPAVLFVDPNVAATSSVFASIGAAVTASHNGDTIKVVAGTYTEDLVINKSLTILGGEVRVSGEPIGPSIIAGFFRRGAFVLVRSNGFELDANNITVRGFTFEQEADAVRTNGAFSGLTVANNTFLDDTSGVHLNTVLTPSAATTTISGNVFTNDSNGVTSQDGVLIDSAGAANVTISNNDFTANDSDAAVKVDATQVSTNVQVLDNVVGNLAIQDNLDNAIVLANATNAKIDGNTIYDPLTVGIELAGAVTKSEIASNTLFADNAHGQSSQGIVLNQDIVQTADTGNKISKNALTVFQTAKSGFQTGILLSLANQNTVTGNIVVHCVFDGIVVAGQSTANSVTGNTSSHNGEFGISVIVANGNTIANNATNGNALTGISLNTASGNTVAKNVADSNAGSGILLTSSNGNTVSGNTADDNLATVNSDTDAGIHLDGSDGNTLSANVVDFNTTLGIALFTSNKNMVLSNTSNFNGVGVSFSGADSNTVSFNIASHNSGAGYQLESAAQQNMLSGNRAVSNLGVGFDSTGSSGNSFTANVANGDFLGGFFLVDGSNLVTNNTADGNGGSGIQITHADGPTSTYVVSGNTANENAENGLVIIGTSDDTITQNIADSNGIDGLDLDTTTDSTVSGNTVEHNQRDGIFVSANSSGNTIERNTALGNGTAILGFDLFDASGTTTNNTWTNNTATTRNPAGLG